jgi:methylated-DNA-[protein]-cysteine S-methyltransferase
MTVSPPEAFTLARLPTPVGTALVVSDPRGRLRAFDWEDYEPRLRRLLRRHYGEGVELRDGPAPAAIAEALAAYFAGNLSALDRLETATGGTGFQREVWAALRAIPPGRTVSYGELAARLGRPKAVRAVGLANGANPVGLVVPCHRVVGARGELTGYAGGLDRKRWLLQHEARHAADASFNRNLKLAG